MACIEFEDGKRVELSAETTDRLRKELIVDDGQLKVDRFRAVKSPAGYGYRLAIMKHSIDVWDGKWPGHSSNAGESYYFEPWEVREIIKGLTEMIGDNDE